MVEDTFAITRNFINHHCFSLHRFITIVDMIAINQNNINNQNISLKRSQCISKKFTFSFDRIFL